MFRVRISFETINYLDIWLNTLDRGSANRRASTYTGKHGHAFMLQAGFETAIPLFEQFKMCCHSAK
jgi:hypothetical protein